MNTPGNDPQDDNLRGRVRELGQHGQQQAPAFRDTWRTAKSMQRQPTPRWRLARLTAAAAAIAGIAVGAATMLHRAPEPHPAIEAAIPNDSALPTDFLLVTNNDDPVRQVAGEIDALLRP